MELAFLVFACLAMIQGATCKDKDAYSCEEDCKKSATIDNTTGIKVCTAMPSKFRDETFRYISNFKIRCCISSETTLINYEWHVEGREINRELAKSYSIIIKNDTLGSYLSFGGEIGGQFRKKNLYFTCKGNTTKGQMNHTIKLVTRFKCGSVNAANAIIVHPEPKHSLEGKSVEFNCTAFSTNEGLRIGWYFNTTNKILKNALKNSSKYEIIPPKNAGNCENMTSILKVHNVSQNDFNNDFTCVLHYNTISDGERKESKSAILLKMETDTKEIENYALGITIALSLLSILIILGIVAYIFRIELLLYLKDKFATLETGGVYDVFICYNSEESEIFVANFMLPRLENDFGYKCFVMDRNANGGEWIPDVVSSKIKDSNRFMLIMSKNISSDPTCIWACEVAIEEAIRGHNLKQLISIYPHDRKKALFTEMAQVDSLKLMCSSSKKIPKVEPKEDEKKLAQFWRKVRLYLPPNRETNAIRARVCKKP